MTDPLRETKDPAPPRIVGGMFGPEPAPESVGRAPFLRGGERFFANARSAARAVAEHLAPRRAWLPSYGCPALFPAFEGIADLRFYPVDGALDPEPGAWRDELAPGDLLVAIDYFGFPADRGLCEEARERGTFVLEDASQALLSEHAGGLGDAVVFSPRKLVGVPDGGVLRSALDVAQPEPAPAAWADKAQRAFEQRGDFDSRGGDRAWFALFQEVERGHPCGAFAMSRTARGVLEDGLDWAGTAARRRANYRVLLEGLADHALFPELPEGVVPLGLPLRHVERDALLAALFAEEVYPAVHWPDLGVPASFEASHRLARELLTLPCDQRCGPPEMERIVRVVRSVVG